MRISFSVPGDPVGKGRPRFSRRGGFITTYTPEKTARYESLVADAAKKAMNGRAPTAGHVSVSIFAYFPVPPSWSKKRRESALKGELARTGRIDADNVCKIICDAMNGIVYQDDVQVDTLYAVKQYSETPHVSVEVISHD